MIHVGSKTEESRIPTPIKVNKSPEWLTFRFNLTRDFGFLVKYWNFINRSDHRLDVLNHVDEYVTTVNTTTKKIVEIPTKIQRFYF